MRYFQSELFENATDESGGAGIEQAARATITALLKSGTLDESHSLKVELIMRGAKALDAEFSRSRLSVAAGQLFSKVLDAADDLPTVQEAMDDAFSRLVGALDDVD